MLKRFGVGRAAALAGLAAGVAAILVAIMLRMGNEPQALLYSGLELKEASEITAALEAAGVKYEAKGDGSTIMVARDAVASTRLLLSAEGLPTSGSVGYEIFDEGSALGQTDFVQQLNRQRALEGELARTIRAIDGVTSVRVSLALPKRELFEEEAQAPTASVLVGLKRGELAMDKVASIRSLVAGAVPDLAPERVTVVDDQGKTLAEGTASDSLTGALAESMKAEEEVKLRRKVQDIVEGVVGPGRARVNVTAELDLARVTTEQKTYDPDGQVVRSTQTSEENSKEQEPDASGSTTAAVNIPEGQEAPGIALATSEAEGAQETTNYEISSTTRTEVQEPGRIKRVAVAVAVDGVTAPGADGKPGAYTPRAPEEMQRIEALVRAAVGFDANRGDIVQVQNVRFSREADAVGGTEASSPLAAFDKNDIMRAVELLILAIVASLLIFFVARPMLKGGGAAASGPMLNVVPGGVRNGGLLPSPTASDAYDTPPADALALPAPDVDSTIDIARIEGAVKASSVKKVSEFVEKHPEQSVNILRNWLHEPQTAA
ncbi:MAG: flagellar M-ring protein FliF [Pseudomonadota bacterium]|nr:flagellar M-ring protein FliF [Pseudomonadota bacterium]